MSDNNSNAPILTVDSKGFLHWRDLRLFVRYENGKLYFPVKHPRDRARLGCGRVGIPVGEFGKLKQPESQVQPARHARREFRAMENAAPVARRNKHLTE